MFPQALLFSLCALSASAQLTTSRTASASTEAETTVTLLALGSVTSGLAGSVVAATPCGETTYALTCTDTDVCDGYRLTFAATAGPTDYKITYDTSTAGATGSVAESCSLDGTTKAVCAATVSLSAGGKHTQTKTTSTLTGTQISYAQYPMTAGANLLASGSASCTVSSQAAAPTAALDVYKVLVVPAAAAAVAAAMM
ncbi:hypothetical protein LTR86_007618 [Recurvomyces mirabilis]|nr:hypothetical protein LTR86_007618 [Recurvomyces mirabilis]